MSDKVRALEFKVGLFMVTGFMFIAVMVFKFGQLGQGFTDFYDLTVAFPNAGGLIKNSDVQLAGARIGYVGDTPRLNDTMTGVLVPLKIRVGQRIPKNTKFQIGSSGLLGDKFVEIVPGDGFDSTSFNPKDEAQLVKPGETIIGANAGGFEALQKKGEAVLESLRNTSEELRVAIAKVNSGVLVDENQRNLTATFENLRKTSESFVAAGNDVKKVVADAQGVIATADSAVRSADTAMKTADAAAGELKIALADARKMIGAAQLAVNKIQSGPGLVPTLLNDRQMSENMRAFIANLRERGVLFYKDRGAAPEPTPARRR